jgi:hypothetical protein
VVNVDENGRATTEECNTANNTDKVVIDMCPDVH